jgi:hypothetical protein
LAQSFGRTLPFVREHYWGSVQRRAANLSPAMFQTNISFTLQGFPTSAPNPNSKLQSVDVPSENTHAYLLT